MKPSIQSQLSDKLQSELAPALLELENESHKHSVPPGSETHFKATIVASEFDGVPRVRRHQRVYGLLTEWLQGPVHALALHLYTPDEWARKEAPVPDSPDCMGGSKKDPLLNPSSEVADKGRSL